MFFNCDGNQTPTWPGDNTLTGGWRQIAISATTAVTVECRERQAGASEGTTITVTTGTSVESGHRSLRITGQHTTNLSEGVAINNGSTTTPDPPSLSPSWGADENLWLALLGVDSFNATVSAFPTNYGNTFSENGGRLVGSAERILNAATEDPGAYTINAATQSRTMTVAFRPAAGGGGGQVVRRMLLGVGV
jgi:hypothetical protein